jgi:mannose-6-phosphate isomerase-like protein (cupin superfamily)
MPIMAANHRRPFRVHIPQEPITAGDVVRFADGDLHGFHNPGDVPFVYLSVTAPPVNFREAYAKDWSRTV